MNREPNVTTEGRTMHRLLTKRILVSAGILLCLAAFFTGCGNRTETTASVVSDGGTGSILHSPDDIGLSTTDGSQYHFTYGGKDFRAIYRTDNWQIRDSYRIIDHNDMVMICRALSAEHPIPDKSGQGVRTPEDLASEWEQHNLAFALLPEGVDLKESARHVDLNPEDQGKSILEFARERLGQP